MNYRFILYILGRLTFGLACIQIVPTIYALLSAEGCCPAFLGSLCISLLLALAMMRYGRFSRKWTISLREGLLSTSAGWLLTGILCALPYLFAGVLSPVEALFESVSGITTTGATGLANVESLPTALLFWRSLTQWLGGMGIIVLFVVLLPQVSGGMAHLFNAEASLFGPDRVMPRIRTAALTIFGIYMVLTLGGFVMLLACGMPLFDAINHTFTTVSTGGFSIYNDGIRHYRDPSIEFALTVLMLLSGANFALYYGGIRKGIKVCLHNTEFKLYVFIFVVVSVFIANDLFLQGHPDAEDLLSAFFQTAAFLTTTGFVAYDFSIWPDFSKLALCFLYFVGGCSGSAAGGFKVGRMAVMVKMLQMEMRRAVHPRMIPEIIFNKRALPPLVIGNIARFFFIYIMTVVVSGLLLSLSGLNLEESIFGAAAALSNIGPSMGGIGANANYAEVNDFAKLVLALTMLLGRLEIFAVLALLRPEFWSKNRNW